MSIPFNKAPYVGSEHYYVNQAIESHNLSGLGTFSKLCEEWFERILSCPRALLTSSCTHALETAALLIEIGPGDEVIMPSFTFVSTANSFLLRGASVIFVDIEPNTMNLDIDQVAQSITSKTKAVVAVHYGGGCCDMERLVALCVEHEIYLIEDAAQAMMSKYKGKLLGTFGDIATFSFHETKNYTSGGEGGLLILNKDSFILKAEIIREKGTNRSLFYRGVVDKYSWVSLGSSYLMSELQAAYLWAQLQNAEEIRAARTRACEIYREALTPLEELGKIEFIQARQGVVSNGHLFGIKVANLDTRTRLLSWLHRQNILAVFHYVPLHSSYFGLRYCTMSGEDIYTTKESNRLIRLPLWYGITQEDQMAVVEVLNSFFSS